MNQSTSKWTDADTIICEDAEASGLAINVKTGEPITFSELQELGPEYDKVRAKITVDEFLKGKTTSVPFDF